MPVILSQSQIRSFYKDTIYNNLPNEEKLDAPIDSRIKDLINQIVELGGKNAIDLGYGYGNHSMILARKGMNVTAIDYIPAEIFQQKVDTFGLTNKIRIISKDIGQLKVNEAFNFVIGKDVLHFLSKQKVKSLMTSLVEMSPSYSIHYYEIFADIVRLADDNSLMKIEDEADFTTQNLIDMVKEVYSKWSVDIRIEDYKENDQAGNKDRFYFIANKVIFTAKSPQIYDRSQKF